MSKKTRSKKVKPGHKVSVHYVGTLDDGTEFDSSRIRDEPLSFEVGSGQLIPGFDRCLPGMKVGEVKSVKLEPGEAYGDVNPEAYQSVPYSHFPEGFKFSVGSVVRGSNETGEEVRARINSVEDDSVVLDFNHPLAGKSLNFEIELISVDS